MCACTSQHIRNTSGAALLCIHVFMERELLWDEYLCPSKSICWNPAPNELLLGGGAPGRWSVMGVEPCCDVTERRWEDGRLWALKWAWECALPWNWTHKPLVHSMMLQLSHPANPTQFLMTKTVAYLSLTFFYLHPNQVLRNKQTQIALQTFSGLLKALSGTSEKDKILMFSSGSESHPTLSGLRNFGSKDKDEFPMKRTLYCFLLINKKCLSVTCSHIFFP